MVTCRVIRHGYWKKVERLTTKLGLDMEHEPGAHPGKLWIAMHDRQGRGRGNLYGMESDICGSGASAKKRYKIQTQDGVRGAD